MREDDAARRAGGIEAAEFLDQIGVGQAVETVALDALCRIAPRDRQQLGDPWHGAVKRGVKACHLTQLRMPTPERLDQSDLARQVIGGVRRDAVQFGEQLGRDPLWLGMLHAVHHAVSCGADRREDRLRLEPLEQETHRSTVIAGGKAAGAGRCSSGVVDDQIRAAQTDAIDLATETPPRRFAGLIHREADARRSAVDRQDAGQRRFHRSTPVTKPPVHPWGDEKVSRTPQPAARNTCCCRRTRARAPPHTRSHNLKTSGSATR